MKKLAASMSLLLAMFFFVAGTGAQNAVAAASTASLNGEVRDPNGSGIVGAKVTIENLDTNLVQHAVTDANGRYQVGDLPMGRYKVSARLANGQMVALNVVDMNATTSAVAATTAAAQLTATVVVNAQAPLVEKTESRIDRTLNTKQILELPGRHEVNGFAVMQAGVVPDSSELQFGSSYRGIIDSLNYGYAGDVLLRENGSAFSVNGTRPNSNYFTIDGAYNMDPIRGTNRQSLPPEASQTFEMINGNFPAQVGRFGGSYVNKISRSGNAGLHGTLMYTWAGNTFNAFSTQERRAYDALTLGAGLAPGDAYRTVRSVVVNNRALASAGFPIWKDKVFSFTSWDRDWFNATASPSTLAITPQGLANLQAASCALAPGSINRLNSVFPIANVPTNRGLIDFLVPACGPGVPPTRPATDPPVPLADYYRGLNQGGIPYDRDYWRFNQRIEAKISDKNSLNLRYVVDDLNDPGFPTAIIGQEVGRVFRNHNGMLNDVHIFSPTFLNEFRFSIGRLADRFDSNLGSGLVIGGFNSVGNPNFPQRRKDTSYQFADNISWSLPRHTLRIGADAIHYQMRANFPFNAAGTLTYSSLEDFLLNQNAVFQQFTGTDFIRSDATEIGVFAQDDWKISRSFSLNLGLRYEYMQIPEGLFSGINGSNKNFGPRFGFAWAPDAGGMLFEKTTFRGGYSLMYNQEMPWQLLPLMARNFPRGLNNVVGPVSGLTTLPGPVTVSQYLAAGGDPDLLPATVVGTTSGGRFKTPYYQTYTLGMEREIGRDFVFRAYYVGTKGTHLYAQYEANPGVTPAAFAANPGLFNGLGLRPVTGPGGAITSYRLNPAFGSTMAIDPIADSIYNSGQFSLIKRFSYGVQFGAHYTYSSAISDADSFLIPLANPFDIGANRGRSNFDQPHRFVGNYLFVVPTVWRDRPGMSRLLSGWELSGITTWASGYPYSVYNSRNALGLLPGQNPFLFNQLASFNPNGVPATGTNFGVANPMFISNPANSGVVSNLGRNTLRTDRFINTDLAAVKSTRTFSEDQSIQFRFEVFNVFNHKSFTQTPLNLVSGSTDLGRFLNLGQNGAAGRSLSFTARYFF